MGHKKIVEPVGSQLKREHLLLSMLLEVFGIRDVLIVHNAGNGFFLLRNSLTMEKESLNVLFASKRKLLHVEFAKKRLRANLEKHMIKHTTMIAFVVASAIRNL